VASAVPTAVAVIKPRGKHSSQSQHLESHLSTRSKKFMAAKCASCSGIASIGVVIEDRLIW
jgi:hypothetical protein